MSEKGEIYIVRIDDGSAPLRDVFKPDYAKARELESGRVRLPPYQEFAISKLERIVRDSGIQQKGVTFIRRRLVVWGLSEIERNYQEEIRQLGIVYDAKFTYYDERQFQKNDDRKILGHRSGKRHTLYLEETDFGRVRELAQVLNLTHNTIEIIAIDYSIMYLRNYFDENLLNETRLDIEDLQTYIREIYSPVVL